MELITTHICKTGEIGLHANMFGGDILSIIDVSSAAYASQICDTPRMVTLSISELLFKQPIKLGNILKTYGKVLEFGNTSVTLYIELRIHNVYTGKQTVALNTNIKFVRIDDSGNPIPIEEKVKERYYERVKKYGKGLLTTEDKEI